MYALDHASPGVPCTTKSSLQALLRTREQASTSKQCDALLAKNDPDENFLNFLSHGHSALKQALLTKGTGSDASEESQDAASVHTQNEVFPSDITPENMDHSGDFSYSQKLFHIADGNLYSIFSPLQGRSYGVKPSFLRKQKCTIQECHGRGRKGLRKGLKFHNFLPSESITSEKDSSYLEDKWKVHSECKLREEHGTKQIMVSNWFRSVKQPVDGDCKDNDLRHVKPISLTRMPVETDTNSCIETTDNTDVSHTNKSTKLPHFTNNRSCSLDTNSHSLFPLNTPTSIEQNVSISNITGPRKTGSEHSNVKNSNGVRHGFLNDILHSITSSKIQAKSTNPEIKSSKRACESSTVFNSQKHRRKPNETRRVVPYTKYLSILEETETHPLDLSLRNSPSDTSNKKTLQSYISRKNKVKLSQSNGVCNKLLKEKLNTKYIAPDVNAFNLNCDTAYNFPVESLMENFGNRTSTSIDYTATVPSILSNAPPPYPCSLPNKQNYDCFKQNMALYDNAILSASTIKNLKLENSHSTPVENVAGTIHKQGNSGYSGSNSSNFNQYQCDNSMLKTIISSKPRKRSQRSVIKQKLEDTFRQNGFLVKTKQVSDGEATFCKFRQLRKYTRYYLKSWQHHLPDEVHKMWKGFLPPKTVLPPISGTTCNTNTELP